MDKDLSEKRIRKTRTENHISAGSALLTSEFGLLRLGELTDEDVKHVIEDAAKSTLRSSFMTAGERDNSDCHQSRHLSSGCERIDEFLGGGFAVRGITEIAGISGCGKTQLCLQLLLTTQYPAELGGLEAAAVYISTEDAFPSQRLHQLILNFPKREKQNPPQFADNIFIEHIAEVNQLQHCLKERLPHLISQKKIGLVVVDSIAGVFRSSYNKEDCHERAESLRSVGGQLHAIAHKHNICVVCINQVTANIANSNHPQDTVPALGLAWANLVTTRLRMTRSDPAINLISRRLETLFSPCLPNKSMNFTVTDGGVRGTN